MGFYYVNGMNRIIMAEAESEGTAAVMEAAVNAVAKGADLTDELSWVTSHVVKNALRGVKGAVKELLAKNEK
uniref:Uncharacterized protein n=1 Tax=Candidatus Methanophaga sp. ANME-1 ERB7 TaxID=2759913 RepID=A0A7G9ZA93_9EURY|nr:hypothetical protein HJKONFEM_00027 [Methanosarcinales archaeon ANME-1 ERB7]